MANHAMTSGVSKTAKISAVVIVFVLMGLVAFGFMQAQAVESDDANASVSVAEDVASDAAAQAIADTFTPHGTEYGKNETVAVKTDLTGTLDSIAVDEWIKNPGGLDQIMDVSSLQNIVADDDVDFTRDGESVIWKAKGEDVAYSGTSSAELPFEVAYRYELDGEEVDPATLKGVSGTLKIQISYRNKTNATVYAAGTAHEVQDPFVMASVISFDAEHAQQVEVDNGTVVDQQGTVMAVGLGMPGLAHTLDIEDMADLPESVEITAQVKGFDMPDITTIATDQVLGKVDAEKTDDVRAQIDDAIGQLDNISTAVEALAKGNKGIATATGKIAEGQAAMAENLPNATEGLKTLAEVADAANQTVAGAAQAQAGIAQNVAASAASQQQALEGQQAVAESQQAAADGQQAALDALSAGVSLDDAVARQQEALDALNAIDADALDDDQKAVVAAAVESLEASLAQTQDSAATAQGAVEQAQASLGEAQTSLESAKTSLDDSTGALQGSLESLAANEEATKTLVQGLGAAAKQTEGLSTGLTQASEGFGKVQEGTQQLSEALAQVSAGSAKLGKAAGKMSDGVAEAIETIQGTINEKIDLVNALSDYVKTKPAYGGSAGDMPSNTLYIVHAKAEATPLR
ncbi:MAG: hypothetical protein Q4D27_04975 [Coriobacteriia bacterium]|nr:hypothetical protein [Coriobacteriia bacterium]